MESSLEVPQVHKFTLCFIRNVKPECYQDRFILVTVIDFKLLYIDPRSWIDQISEAKESFKMVE